jgi:hypothetical protein
MDTLKIIREVEITIRNTLRKIRTSEDPPSPNMLLGAGKLVNSYRKLLEISQMLKGSEGSPSAWDSEETGHLTYHDRLEMEIMAENKRRLKG